MPRRMKFVSLEKIQTISKKRNGKPLTMKQAVFVQEYAKTGNASLSAREAYASQKENTARAVGSENLTKPAVRKVLLEVMEDTGLTDEYLMEKVRRGIERTEKHFDYTKLALQLKGKLQQNVSVSFSAVAEEARKKYDL